MTQPKDTNEQALRESRVDELDDVFKEVLYCLNNNSASNLCSDCVEMRDRAKTVITALRVRDRIDELKWVGTVGSISNHCDSGEYQLEIDEVADRIAELESQLNTGKSK